MQSDTFEERYAIKVCFKLGKNATETYGMLQTAFRSSCMSRASVFEWHKRLKEGREPVRDDERCGRSKEVCKDLSVTKHSFFNVMISKEYHFDVSGIQIFFPSPKAVALPKQESSVCRTSLPIVQYDCITWTLMKYLEKKISWNLRKDTACCLNAFSYTANNNSLPEKKKYIMLIIEF